MEKKQNVQKVLDVVVIRPGIRHGDRILRMPLFSVVYRSEYQTERGVRIGAKQRTQVAAASRGEAVRLVLGVAK